jgi:hypothetical protein
MYWSKLSQTMSREVHDWSEAPGIEFSTGHVEDEETDLRGRGRS